MRIHHLRISGFGPFAGTEDIDFDRLSAHGLFLLNGPTGAGKTSVLDAICFALYGSVPGARQDGKRLRSDHAEPGREPAVTLRILRAGAPLRGHPFAGVGQAQRPRQERLHHPAGQDAAP